MRMHGPSHRFLFLEEYPFLSASIYLLLDSRKACKHAKDSFKAVLLPGFYFSCIGCFIGSSHLLQSCIVDFGYLLTERMSSESVDFNDQ